MRMILKVVFIFSFIIVGYTLFVNWKIGNPWTKEALLNQLGVTLGIVEYRSMIIKDEASEEAGRVLGEMTRRMGKEPIWQAISGTISDEAKAVPYNICKPVVENYESK